MKTTVVGKTKKGKNIGYGVRDGEALYSIYFPSGGEVPEQLTGMWTDERQIINAITTYINKDTFCKPDQEKKDYKKAVNAAKRRSSKLKQKVAPNAN